jgi:anti-sigma factor RsiW
MTNCKDCRSHLPDLLLDDAYAAAHPELNGHLAACAECRAELAELRSTFALLDEWQAPEISPYFDSKLHARLREAVEAEPAGFWERMRSFVLYSTGRQLRPALAGALACAMILSGGGTLVFFNFGPQHPAATSATVNDLLILDNNAQTLQQMDQLTNDAGSDDNSDPPTT